MPNTLPVLLSIFDLLLISIFIGVTSAWYLAGIRAYALSLLPMPQFPQKKSLTCEPDQTLCSAPMSTSRYVCVPPIDS